MYDFNVKTVAKAMVQAMTEMSGVAQEEEPEEMGMQILNHLTEQGATLNQIECAINIIKEVNEDISETVLNGMLLAKMGKEGPSWFQDCEREWNEKHKDKPPEGKKTRSNAMEIKSLASILESDLQPPKMVIKGLLTPGLTVFASAPKSGKSWLCLQLAINVVQGKELFSRKVEKGNVLYLALEDSEYRLKDRTNKLLLANQTGKDIPGLYATTKAKLLDKGLLEDLKQYIDELQLKVIIIDTLQKIKSVHGKSQEYGYEYKAQGMLQEFALENNVAIIIVHHTSKQGEYKKDNVFETIHGSQAIPGACDTMWVLEKKRNGDAVLYARGRDVEDQELSLRWDNDFCTWVYQGNEEDQIRYKEKAKFEKDKITIAIKNMLETSNGEFQMTASQLLKVADVNKATRTVSVWLKQCEEFFEEDNISVEMPTGTTSINGEIGRYITFKKI